MKFIDRLSRGFKKRPGGGSSGNLAALLPWYLNGTLSPSEKQAMARWLGRNSGDLPEAPAPHQTELVAWRELKRAVRSQPAAFPSPAVWRRVASEVSSSPSRSPAPNRARLALGTCFALLLLALLWLVLQPGILLEWSATGGRVAAFRIYRTPPGSTDYNLVGQMPADPNLDRYCYVDARLWPGQKFVYRIDAVGAGGQAAASQIVSGNSLLALPGQMAVGAVGLIIGYGVVALSGPWPGLRRTDEQSV